MARFRKPKPFYVRLVSLYVMLATTTFALDCGSLERLKRCFPRALRAFRRQHSVNYKRLLEESRKEAKFQMAQTNLSVRVISLQRLRERRAETMHSLDEQGVPWKIHTAVDGLAELDTEFVRKYAGRKKQQRLRETLMMDDVTLYRLKRDCDNSKRVPQRLRQSLHERLRFGCFMSHILVWREVVRTKSPYAVILEDDAIIAANFSSDVTSRLTRLPRNWDLFYLNGCFRKLGLMYDDGIRQSRGGLCTYGYAISIKAAYYLTRQAALRSEKPIDHVLDEETLSGRVLAFHADPPLVYTSLTIKSSLLY